MTGNNTYNFKVKRKQFHIGKKAPKITPIRDAFAFVPETSGRLLNVQSCSSHVGCGFFFQHQPCFCRFAQALCFSGAGPCSFCIHAASVFEIWPWLWVRVWVTEEGVFCLKHNLIYLCWEGEDRFGSWLTGWPASTQKWLFRLSGGLCGEGVWWWWEWCWGGGGGGCR